MSAIGNKVEKVIIIGSGPAGHTAAIYTARAELNPLMLEGFMAGGIAAGGQLTTTADVENYPGFPDGINGFDLMLKMRQQSINCGARIKTETVNKIFLNQSPFKVFTNENEYLAKVVIIATGATARRLHILGEDKFWQKGISACAVCDGALPVFRDKILVVVGGGDSACEEAIFLSKFASSVIMLVRRDVMRASNIMQKRIQSNDKINVMWNTVILEAVGYNNLTGVKVKHVKTEQESLVSCTGLFFALGHIPNTNFLNGQVKIDNNGYIITGAGGTATSIPGVFACGDVQDSVFRQAVTAAGTGCMAAIETVHYLENI